MSDQYRDSVQQMDREVYERLVDSLATGRWPDGRALTDAQRQHAMRAVITGQIGIDKKPYLQEVCDLAGHRGGHIDLFNVGKMMYQEGPDIRPGRILDLPLSRLASLRRAAFKDII